MATHTLYIYPNTIKFSGEAVLDSDTSNILATFSHTDCIAATYNNQECLAYNITNDATSVTFNIKPAFSTLVYYGYTYSSNTIVYLDLSTFLENQDNNAIKLDRLYAYNSSNNEFDTVYLSEPLDTNPPSNWYNEHGLNISHFLYKDGILADDNAILTFLDGDSEYSYVNSQYKIEVSGAMNGWSDINLYENDTLIQNYGDRGSHYGVQSGVHYVNPNSTITLNDNTNGVSVTVTQGDTVLVENHWIYSSGTGYSFVATNDTTIRIVGGFTCCVPEYASISYLNNKKPAADVKNGDIILGYNVKTNEIQEVEVLDIIKKYRTELVVIKFEDNSILEVTPDHPVYTNLGWACYRVEDSVYKNLHDIGELLQLTTHMSILKQDNKFYKIQEIEYKKFENPITTYTFNTTNGIDTFIAEGCIVHNACDK